MVHSFGCGAAPDPFTPLCFTGTGPACASRAAGWQQTVPPQPPRPAKPHAQGADFSTGKQGQEYPACLGTISGSHLSVHGAQSAHRELSKMWGIRSTSSDPSDSNRRCLIPEGSRLRGGIPGPLAQILLTRPISGSGAEKTLRVL